MPKIECSEPLKPPMTPIATTAPASAMPIEKISPYLWMLNHHHSAFQMLTLRCRPVSVGFGFPNRITRMQIGTSTNQIETIRMAW